MRRFLSQSVPSQEVRIVPILATTNGGFYKLFFVLHIFCAIVGFGAVYLNALYGQEIRKHRGPEGLAIYEANYRVSQIGQYFIYAVFIFGFALIGLSDSVWKFSQTWIWLSVVLFVIGIGLSHSVLLPSVRRMGVLMREMIAAGPPAGGPPPQAAEMEQLGKKIGATSATLNVLVVVLLFLMVWKPGV
jgi:hypothetical protein